MGNVEFILVLLALLSRTTRILLRKIGVNSMSMINII